MGELIFAMIVAIVGSVMTFVVILALFYIFSLLTIKAFKKLKQEWDKDDTHT